MDTCQVASMRWEARRRLSPDARRDELLDVGGRLFAAHPYRDVLMQDVAAAAGVSRALLYQYFPAKRDLFAGVYNAPPSVCWRRPRSTTAPRFLDQVAAGLDAHIDYFTANRQTVLAANRDLAGDPVIQAIITDELAVLRQRLLDHLPVDADRRAAPSAVLTSWLIFVPQPRRRVADPAQLHTSSSGTSVADTLVAALTTTTTRASRGHGLAREMHPHRTWRPVTASAPCAASGMVRSGIRPKAVGASRGRHRRVERSLRSGERLRRRARPRSLRR